MPPFLIKGDNMARKIGKKQMVRSLVDSIYQSAIRDQKAQMQAQQAQFTPVVTDSGLTKDDIDRIYNSAIAAKNQTTPQTSAQEIPKLEDNSLPSAGNPTIASELERMQKMKAENKPRSESEQRAIDTYLADLQRASAPDFKPDYQTEIERMNALNNDTETNWSEGEVNARNDYLAKLQDALAEEQRKNAIVTNPTVKRTSSRKKSANEVVKDEPKKEQTNFTRTMSANEQRDFERAMKAVANTRGRALSANEQRDMERAMNAAAKAKVTSEEGKGSVEEQFADIPSGDVLNTLIRKPTPSPMKAENLLNTTAQPTATPDRVISQLEQGEKGITQPEVKKEQTRYDDRGFALGETQDMKIDRFVSPDTRMTKDEKKEAKEIVKDYFDNNPLAKRANTTNNANEAAYLINSMSDAERAEYQRMVTLQNKANGLTSYAQGIISSTPFLKSGGDKLSEAMGVDERYNVSNQLANAQTQNPLLYGAGDMTTKIAEYSNLTPMLEKIPVLGEIGGSSAVGNALGNILRGTVADVLIDTIPREIENIQNGMGFGDVLKDAAGNVALNTAFNAGTEAIPYVVKGVGNLINGRTADQAADIIRNTDELNPAEMARQNEDISDAIAKQKQAEQNVQDLADDLAKQTDNMQEEITEQAVKNNAEGRRFTEDDVNEMVREIEEGGSGPVREFNTPDSGELNERGLANHLRSQVDVRVATPMKVEGVSDEVATDFVDNPDLYKVLKNKDTKALADNIYNSGDATIRVNGKEYTGNVETKFRTLLSEKNPSALPLGHQLAKDYSAAGNHEMAAQIYRDMGQALTESGQFSQAAIINMIRNDPLTALQYAEKQLDAINAQGASKFGKKWQDFSLTEDEIKAFNSITPGDEKAIKALYDKIGARLGKEYPTTFMEKLLEGRKVAMLFNIRTNVRNFGANVPTLGMRWISDRVDAVGQNIAHLINPNFKVTNSLLGSGANGRKLANEVFNSDTVQTLIKGQSGKYEIPELKNSLMKDRQMFKGTAVSKWINKVTNGGIEKMNKTLFNKEGVESGLETIRNATYKMLDLGDSPFVKENFVERLGSYINAQNIKSIDDIPDEAIQMAWEEAMKATYKDDSWAVEMLRGLKQGMEKIPGVGKPLSQAVIPFLQAPGNIAARMIDYSPIKATKGVVDIISGATKGSEVAVRKGIEEAAKGLTGTGLIILGMRLHESGILTGNYSEDKDQKNFEKQNGFKPWALHIGDKYFTYDWAQPFGEPLIIGSLLSEAIQNSDKYDSDILNHFGIEGSTAGSIIGATKEGAKASLNSWFNASPLQGLAELMQGDYSGNADIAQNLFDVGVSDFAGALVPAQVNAVAKSIDPTQRNTYDPSSKFGTFLNQQQAKIPGLSDNLPAKYNTWGDEMKYADSVTESALQRNLVPGDYGKDTDDPINMEINRLFESPEGTSYDERGFQLNNSIAGDEGVFPLVAPNSVGGRKLNNEEVSAYQQDMGQRSRQIVETFMNSELYQNMDDAQRIDTLKNIYGISKAITERDLFGKPVSDTYKKKVEAFDNGNVEGLIQELQYQNALNDSGLSNSEKNREIFNTNGAEGLQQLVEQKQSAIDSGYVKKDGTANLDAYNNVLSVVGSESQAKSYKQFADNMNAKGYTKQKDYIPYVENMSGLTNDQKGQYIMLYSGTKPTETSLGKNAWAAYDKYGYEGYYRYKLLQEVKDYPSKNHPNGDGKHDTYDRIQQLYDWDYKDKTEEYKFYTGLKY